MNKTHFNKGIAVLIASFPEKEFIGSIIYECVKDLSDEQFSQAIIRILKTEKQLNKAMNVIALIRKNALTSNKKLSGEAWQEVLNQIGKVGSYGIPKFSDPIIGKTVDCIGWKHLCMSTNIMVERAHFLKIYDTFINREQYALTLGKQLPLDIKKLEMR